MDVFAKKMIANGQTVISNYLLSNFTKIGMTPDELVMFLQIKRYSDEGIQFPDINKITDSTGYTKSQAYEILHEMIHRKLMTIITTYDQNHNRCDKYDFALMYQKLNQLGHGHHDSNDNWRLNQINRYDKSNVTVSVRTHVFKSIGREFGRDLSPMEISTVSKWFDKDHFQPKMIMQALREAVLSQVFNLRYISRILSNWDRKGITNLRQLQNARKHRHNYRNNHSSRNLDGSDIPIFKL